MECVKWILNGFAPFTKGMFFLKARLFIHFFAGNVGQYLVYFDRNFKLKYNEILVFFLYTVANLSACNPKYMSSCLRNYKDSLTVGKVRDKFSTKVFWVF